MEQRCQALSLVIQDGESVVEVARRFGVSRQTVHLLGLLPLQHQRKAEKTKGEFVKLGDVPGGGGFSALIVG